MKGDSFEAYCLFMVADVVVPRARGTSIKFVFRSCPSARQLR